MLLREKLCVWLVHAVYADEVVSHVFKHKEKQFAARKAFPTLDQGFYVSKPFSISMSVTLDGSRSTVTVLQYPVSLAQIMTGMPIDH